MSNFIISLTYGGETGTIKPDIGFRYTDKLNEVNEAEMKLSSSSPARRTLLQVGAIIEITRDGTREFYGILDSLDYLDGGAMSVHFTGYEQWLGKEPRVFANSPWTSTASATIFSAILAESSYFTGGTVEAGSSVDFKASISESLWNAIGRLSRKVQQDVQIDYPNLEVDILDHRGVSTPVQVFNDGIQMKNLRVSFTHPMGNSIKVWGKGDGINQITATVTDATSISTYGTIVRNVTDPTLISTADATARANAELVLTKDPTKVYDFEIVNPNQALVGGDEILLNSKDKDLTNEQVRITGIEKGMNGIKEYLNYQVCNSGWSKLLKNNNLLMSGLARDNVQTNTYMQGSGNLSQWAGMINANNTAGLSIPFEISTQFTDEAGTMRVNSLTIDYDVDPYRKGVGLASYDGADPQVQNTSGDDDATVSGTTAIQDRDADADSFWVSVNGGGDSNHTLGVPFITGDAEITFFSFFLQTENWNAAHSGYIITIENVDTTTTYATGTVCLTANHYSVTFPVLGNIDGDDVKVTIDDNSATGDSYTYGLAATVLGVHDHAKGTLAADNHSHPDGAYDVNASDIDDISIGDSVSDAGAVNATQVVLYLDYWNGSSWINKITVAGTGKTLDTGYDMSQGGNYPDATGLWRIRIFTDSVTPDLVQGIVTVKHNLDS